MALISDLSHYWGSDLSLSVVGDLAPASGTLRGQQRVLRRLLTNPGDYIWHPTYGAGLPSKVGSNANINEITALIRGQILLEDVVAATPAPQITVTTIDSALAVQITYTDAPSGQAVTLSFDLSE
jgi:hypothetical protein